MTQTPDPGGPRPVPLLDRVEERVLGSLLEKAATTPEYYPMSLNALTNACNQKSNRHPVVELDEKSVARALESLREKGLVRILSGADQRVPKYRQVLAEAFGFSPPQAALLCELMIRGPQTAGELRSRAGRMHPFDELARVEAVLQELAARPEPAVAKLPRQPGRKESRYAHLLAGAPEAAAVEAGGREPAPEAAVLEVRAEHDRIARLEGAVEGLRAEVAELRSQLASFCKQFE